MRFAAPVRLGAEVSSLSLHELNKDAPGHHNLIAVLQTGADVVLLPDPIAEGYVPPREAAVGLSDVDKRQVLVIAQNR
jgi:hypothetical protein